jgi:hypothetical protein
MKRPRSMVRFAMAGATVGMVALGLGQSVRGQNTIGGDAFVPGQADFVQSGSQVGRGPGFQFSDAFYTANGINPEVLRQQEQAPFGNPLAPSRFGAFFRQATDAGAVPDVPPDDRFSDARIRVHNMGFNAAGEMLFYPDPPAFFFGDAFMNAETRDVANRSLVFLFPRTKPANQAIPGCPPEPRPAFSPDLLDPHPCNRRQDNIFDTGNGYLTQNPLQLWRIVFVTWDGPDINTHECQTKIAELTERNGLDLEGTPILKRVRDVLDVAGPNMIAGQGSEAVLLPNELGHALKASGVPNPDYRLDIPGVEAYPGGQACVTVRTRRQESGGLPASKENRLDGPPFVV